jgi:hypothetical protein
MLGIPSGDELLIVGPRLTGLAHSSSVVARIDTHRSSAPEPPDRPVPKYISNPSADRHGPHSSKELLAGCPRFMGVPNVKSAFTLLLVLAKNTNNTIRNIFVLLLIFCSP